MSEPEATAAPPDTDEQMLARLAAFDVAAAEKVHGKLMAAEEASEIAELGRTYQRLARSLRQTLALKAKLARDREAAAREAPAAKPPAAAVARRVREVRAAVIRVIWDEVESPEDGDFGEEMLEAWLAEEALSDGFCAETLDEQVARVCEDLGLTAARAARWRELPDPTADAPPDDPPADPAHESSA